MKEKCATAIQAPVEIQEAFFSMYFLFEVLTKDFVPEKTLRYVYDRLAEICHIHSRDELDKAYGCLSDTIIRSADRKSYYYLIRRAMNYRDDCLTQEQKSLIFRKENAISIKDMLFGEIEPDSAETVIEKLHMAANGGNTDCMALLAFIELEEMLVLPDKKHAEKLCETLARWNHLGGCLVGYAFLDEKHQSKLLPSMYAALSHAASLDVSEYLRTEFGKTCREKDTVLPLALEEVFDCGYIERRKTDPITMKILCSPVLDDNGKKSLLLCKPSPEMINLFPLEIGHRGRIYHHLRRLTEKSGLGENLSAVKSNIGLFGAEIPYSYKPLLFISESTAVLENLRAALTHCFEDSKIENIDFGNPANCDFSHSRENSIISFLEKTNTVGCVLFMDNVDEIPFDRAVEFSHLIRQDYVENYRLANFPVMIHLKGFLPILFSTTRPCDEILDVCDAIELDKKDERDINTVISEITERCRAMLGVESVRLEDETVKYLSDMEPYQIEEAIYKALFLLSRDDETGDIIISPEIIKSFHIEKTPPVGNNVFGRSH